MRFHEYTDYLLEKVNKYEHTHIYLYMYTYVHNIILVLLSQK